MSGQHVFMAQEQDALIVLLPREESAAGEEARQPVRVPLNNRMAPTVKLVQLEEKEPGVYRYEYEFCNASSAQDPIEIVMFKIPLARERFCMSQQSSAASWVAPCAPGAERTQIVHPDFPWTSYSSWIRPLEQPAVEPGQCLGGFSILSDFLPGFKTAGFRGAIIKYAPDRMTWPEEVLHQAGSLEERSWFEKYFHDDRSHIPPRDAEGEHRKKLFGRNRSTGAAGEVRPGLCLSCGAFGATEEVARECGSHGFAIGSRAVIPNREGTYLERYCSAFPLTRDLNSLAGLRTRDGPRALRPDNRWASLPKSRMYLKTK